MSSAYVFISLANFSTLEGSHLLINHYHSVHCVSDFSFPTLLDQIAMLLAKRRIRLERASALADELCAFKAPSDRLMLEDAPLHLFTDPEPEGEVLESLLNSCSLSPTRNTSPGYEFDAPLYDDEYGSMNSSLIYSFYSPADAGNSDSPDSVTNVALWSSTQRGRMLVDSTDFKIHGAPMCENVDTFSGVESGFLWKNSNVAEAGASREVSTDVIQGFESQRNSSDLQLVSFSTEMDQHKCFTQNDFNSLRLSCELTSTVVDFLLKSHLSADIGDDGYHNLFCIWPSIYISTSPDVNDFVARIAREPKDRFDRCRFQLLPYYIGNRWQLAVYDSKSQAVCRYDAFPIAGNAHSIPYVRALATPSFPIQLTKGQILQHWLDVNGVNSRTVSFLCHSFKV